MELLGKLGRALDPSRLFEAANQTASEQKLVGFIKNRVEEVRGSGTRISHEGIWMTNTAYLLGYDSIYFDTQTRTFKPNQANTRFLKRNRVHLNKILPTCQNRLARLCKSPPKYDVRPNSNDQDDKDAARLSLQILEMLWDKERLNQKRIELYMWMQQCGHAFIKVCWDDTMGKPLLDPETGAFLGYEGDVRVEVCSAFEWFVDPLAKRMEDAQWAIQAKVRKLDYFRSHYGPRGAAVKEEDAWLLSANYEQRINSLNNAGPQASSPGLQMKGAAIELAYYERRSKEYPNGRMVITANGVLLADRELPVGEIPAVKFDDIIVGGKFYSEAIITHMRPVQDHLNKNQSMRAAWMNRLLAGKYIVAKGHGIMQESPNDQSGELIQYDPVPGADAPRALDVPQIPSYAYKEEESAQSHLAEISGISEASKGQMPSATIPAIGMQLLVEQDETRIGVMTEWNEEGWAIVGKLMLLYVSKYYKTPRLLKLAGANRSYEVKEFIGADIKDNTDVAVIRGSTTPGSKVVKRQEIMNAFNQGLLGDPADPKVRERVLNMMEYGELAEVWQDQALDMQQIKRDLDAIERGEAPTPAEELDNHEAHVFYKNRYRKSEKFISLEPEQRAMLMKNLDEHLDWIIKLSMPPEQLEAEPPTEDDLLAATAAEEGAALPGDAAVEGAPPGAAPDPGLVPPLADVPPGAQDMEQA